MTIRESRFRVMASDAHVVLVDPAPGAEDYARRRLQVLEDRWSRFLPGSDISRLNEAPEAFLFVSCETIALLSAMREAWQETRGRYDPTLLAPVLAEGYSRSWDGSGRASRMARRASRSCTIADVTVDETTSAVVVPAGVGLDPGGIGKGLAADMVVAELLRDGTGGALVGIGGDLAAAGTSPTAAGWHVAVEDPRDPDRCLTILALGAGGVATSSTLSRAWVLGGRRRHHVIDPSTRTCATTDLAAVTVVARAGWEAEAHATAALLSGSERVLTYLDRHGLAGLATTLEGVTVMSSRLQEDGDVAGSAA